MKTYVEKLTQSWTFMRRNWHNHENLCGETYTITKTYVEKLTIMKVSPQKFSWLCQFLHISFHDCVNFSTWAFMIVSVSPNKFSWNWHNHENLCGETYTITKTYVEKLTIMKIMWRNLHNHENLCGETDTITKIYVDSPHKFSWLCKSNHLILMIVSFST
jgi:nitrogen regulatory protein PII-like uncharacterized protein